MHSVKSTIWYNTLGPGAHILNITPILSIESWIQEHAFYLHHLVGHTMSLHSPKFCIICIANEDCFLILWYAVIALSQTYKTVLAVCDQRLFTIKHLACLNVMFLPVSIATVSEIFKGSMWLQCCRFQGVSLSYYTPHTLSHTLYLHCVCSLWLRLQVTSKQCRPARC